MPYQAKYPFREEVLAKQYAIPLDLKTRENSTLKNEDGLCKSDWMQFLRENITLLAIFALVAVIFMVLLFCEPTPHKKGGDAHAGSRCFIAEGIQSNSQDDAAGV
jgi:hypothetical protein